MIVFTIYKNGGNAGVLGASFSCAVFGVRGSSGVNAGAQLLGRALSNKGGIVGFDWGKDSTRPVSDCAFAVAGSLGRYRLNTTERAQVIEDSA